MANDNDDAFTLSAEVLPGATPEAKAIAAHAAWCDDGHEIISDGDSWKCSCGARGILPGTRR